MLAWLLVLLAILVAAFYLISGTEGEALSGGHIAYIIGGAALVLLYLATIADDYRGRIGTAFRHIAIWIAALFVLVGVYAYRGEFMGVFQRVAGEVVPPGIGIEINPGTGGERAVRVRRQGSGHFAVRGEVNGQTMTLLVDTGASSVVLKQADAARAGVDTAKLAFSVPVQTANGQTYAAPVRLRSITIGPIEVRDVEALVSKPGSLNESLLGMSFLRRLRSYEFSGEFLTLRGGAS